MSITDLSPEFLSVAERKQPFYPEFPEFPNFFLNLSSLVLSEVARQQVALRMTSSHVRSLNNLGRLIRPAKGQSIRYVDFFPVEGLV
jgi:hypothetical protein